MLLFFFFIIGLTCTDENFAQKATIAFQTASLNNLIIVLPDTSPRGAGCPDDTAAWDFGEGAGFYINATNPSYSKHYNMYDYITIELWDILLQTLFPQQLTGKRSIFGHSMGGFGALHLFLKSQLFTSCSAFAPIADPVNCPWGQKAFSKYFGPQDQVPTEWTNHDLPYLLHQYAVNTTTNKTPILIDQGLADPFLKQNQLLPERFLQQAKDDKIDVIYRQHEKYDHGYYFIHTFVVDHINHHIAQLNKE